MTSSHSATDSYEHFLRGKQIRVCVSMSPLVSLLPLYLARLQSYGAVISLQMTKAAEETYGRTFFESVVNVKEKMVSPDAVVIFSADATDAATLSSSTTDAELNSCIDADTPVIFILEDCQLDRMLVDTARAVTRDPLAGKIVLLTAGPTWGLIDPVRFISNRSSGQLGIHIAREFYIRGARVLLVMGPAAVAAPPYIECKHVETSQDMLEACEQWLTTENCNAAIFAAAVNDYVPDQKATEKIRSGGELKIEFTAAPRIITAIDDVPRKGKVPLIKVGFKLETAATDEDLLDTARSAMKSNGCNILVANQLRDVGTEAHRAWILQADGSTTMVSTKQEIAATLADLLGLRL